MKNSAQNAFTLADKLHTFYNSGPGHSENINTCLLEHLGPQKYKKLCENIKNVQLTISSPQFFSEKFIDNPVSMPHIVNDETVKDQWTLSSLLKVVKELL